LPLSVQPTETEETVKIVVTDYREGGSFEFGSRTYDVAETTNTVMVEIQRNQGSKGTVHVQYKSVNGTASGNGIDYENVNGTLIFEDGERMKYLTIAIKDDVVIEEHLEQFIIELTAVTVMTDINDLSLPPVGGLGSPTRTTVSIYDYGDRIQKASTTFPSSPGGDRSHLKGWTVVGNGIRNPAWLDPDGLYSVDQMFNGVGAAFSKMTDSVIHATTTTTTTNTNTSTESICDGNVGNSKLNRLNGMSSDGGGSSSSSQSSSSSSTTSSASSGIRFDGGGVNV